MTRPTEEVIALVDRKVAELDAAVSDEPLVGRSTSSYGVIALAWERFKATVDGIDAAVECPFNTGAAEVLGRADVLLDHQAYQLAFWLKHVSAALAER